MDAEMSNTEYKSTFEEIMKILNPEIKNAMLQTSYKSTPKAHTSDLSRYG
jgi:hypothetical protein